VNIYIYCIVSGRLSRLASFLLKYETLRRRRPWIRDDERAIIVVLVVAIVVLHLHVTVSLVVEWLVWRKRWKRRWTGCYSIIRSEELLLSLPPLATTVQGNGKDIDRDTGNDPPTQPPPYSSSPLDACVHIHTHIK
jgi:hypothetical protein